jgi:hypothetical protein
MYIPEGIEIFLFSKTSGVALGLTQPYNYRVPNVLIPQIKRLGHEVDHAFPSSTEVKYEWN